MEIGDKVLVTFKAVYTGNAHSKATEVEYELPDGLHERFWIPNESIRRLLEWTNQSISLN